jgi:hypothetical protein
MAIEPIKNLPPLSASALERMRAGLSLPDDTLKKIGEWAKDNYQVLIGNEFDEPAVNERLGVPAFQYYGALSVITALVFSSEPLSVEAYLEELKKQGLGDVTEKARLLLGGMAFDPEVADLAKQRALAVQSVVPTVNTVDCVCELRAIFRHAPSPNQSTEHVRDVGILLGFEPMVLVNIDLNDAAGVDHACNFQLTERSLKAVLKVLEEAMTQLQAIKESTVRSKESK